MTKILGLIIMLFAVVGCDQKSSSNSSGTSTQCLANPYTGVCDNSVYNSANGFQAYPGAPGYSSDPNSVFRYQLDQYYFSQNGSLSALCACPVGSRPVYNGSLGIGCAQSALVPTWAPIYFHALNTVSGSNINSHYVNIPQMSNINNQFQNGCYSNVAWSCLIGQNNQCPGGSACQASASNSPIGICVRTQ